MEHIEADQIIHRFGLEAVLSFEDDPLLWVSALKKYWINTPCISNQDYSFYLDVAVADDENVVGLRAIENWKLERRMDECFKPVRWNDPSPAPFSPGGLPFEMPYGYLAIERPSMNKNAALVCEAVILAEQYGFAETHIWKRYRPRILKRPWSGKWRQTMRRIYVWRG